MTEVKILRMCKYCKGNIEVLPDEEAQELIDKGLAIRSFIYGGVVNTHAVLDATDNQKESIIELEVLDNKVKTVKKK